MGVCKFAAFLVEIVESEAYVFENLQLLFEN